MEIISYAIFAWTLIVSSMQVEKIQLERKICMVCCQELIDAYSLMSPAVPEFYFFIKVEKHPPSNLE